VCSTRYRIIVALSTPDRAAFPAQDRRIENHVQSAPAPRRTAAVVVLYEPPADLLNNVATYLGQVDRVFAVDNTPTPDPTLIDALSGLGVRVLPMGGNRGIAAALNAGCRAAIEAGYDLALTLDQDSTPAPDLVEKLALCLGEPGSDDVLLVAPVWQIEGGLPEEISARCVEIGFAMTSGNLVRLDLFEKVGGFREDLFIDRVDTEFCLRGRTMGLRVLQRRDAVLLHRAGRLEEKRCPFRHFVTNYPAIRRYYMARNVLELNRLYGREFPEWVKGERHQWSRDLPKILMSERDRLQKLTHIVRGVLDYRARRFGSYDDIRRAGR
jgi:rhamnosyltransferase